jgi:hypothetical protein
MRIILGAPKSTPIKEMLLELNLQSLKTRKTWLSGRYIIRIEKQPNHPMYSICLNLRRNPTNWKNQNTPSLKHATSHITLAGLQLFQSKQSPKHGIKPWEIIPIITDYLEISKKKALSNSVKARSVFYEYKNKANITTEAYTDGSLNKETRIRPMLQSSPPGI